MKTLSLRVLFLGLSLPGLFLNVGCGGHTANSEVPLYHAQIPTYATAAEENVTPTNALAKPLVEAVAPTNASIPVVETGALANAPAPALEAPPAATNASVQVEAPEITPGDDTNAAPIQVEAPVLPENLDLSPALTEVVKMVQAGVNEGVILSYVTNSEQTYGLDSDKIIYLSDLGVSATVLTALIQQDSSPNSASRKALNTALNSLPPGASLSQPASNIYPASISSQATYIYEDTATTATPGMPPAVQETTPAATTTDYASLVSTNVTETNVVNYFYDALAPYGSWMVVEDYGWVWQPSVVVANSSWRPYRDRGRWLWTDHGWYWYSDYTWGWAPFHYGRWSEHSRFGWFWVPDRHWGPSWVTWRYTPQHCGWAPLPPDCHYVPGFGLYYRNGSVSASFDFGYRPDYYSWIHLNRFCDPVPGPYFIPPHHVHNIHYQSVPANHLVWHRHGPRNEGLPFSRVSRATRADIPLIQVHPQPHGPHHPGRPERLEGRGPRPGLVTATLPPVPPSSRLAPPPRGAQPGMNPPGPGAPGRPQRPSPGPGVVPPRRGNGLVAVSQDNNLPPAQAGPGRPGNGPGVGNPPPGSRPGSGNAAPPQAGSPNPPRPPGGNPPTAGVRPPGGPGQGNAVSPGGPGTGNRPPQPGNRPPGSNQQPGTGNRPPGSDQAPVQGIARPTTPTAPATQNTLPGRPATTPAQPNRPVTTDGQRATPSVGQPFQPRTERPAVAPGSRPSQPAVPTVSPSASIPANPARSFSAPAPVATPRPAQPSFSPPPQPSARAFTPPSAPVPRPSQPAYSAPPPRFEARSAPPAPRAEAPRIAAPSGPPQGGPRSSPPSGGGGGSGRRGGRD